MHLKFTRLPPSPLLPPLPLQFTEIGSTVFVRTERWTERERERVRLCERVNIKLNGFYEIEQTIEWFSLMTSPLNQILASNFAFYRIARGTGDYFHTEIDGV